MRRWKSSVEPAEKSIAEIITALSDLRSEVRELALGQYQNTYLPSRGQVGFFRRAVASPHSHSDISLVSDSPEILRRMALGTEETQEKGATPTKAAAAAGELLKKPQK
jgi:hypothetical protein